MVLNEKQLIGEIRKLRQIKPEKDWVSLTKKEILGQEPGFTFSLYFKPALVGLMTIFVVFGALGYGLVKSSLPGDVLYALRKAVHQGQAVFVSETEKSAFQLKLANDRLEDLANAPAGNLVPTISEFQTNIAEAARDLAKIDATTSDPVAIKRFLEATRELEGNIEKVISLGVVVEIEEFRSILAEKEVKWVKDIIGQLESQAAFGVLNEDQEKILGQMKELVIEGKYPAALELYLINQ